MHVEGQANVVRRGAAFDEPFYSSRMGEPVFELPMRLAGPYVKQGFRASHTAS
jgi:hypothetical protein